MWTVTGSRSTTLDPRLWTPLLVSYSLERSLSCSFGKASTASLAADSSFSKSIDFFLYKLSAPALFFVQPSLQARSYYVWHCLKTFPQLRLQSFSWSGESSLLASLTVPWALTALVSLWCRSSEPEVFWLYLWGAYFNSVPFKTNRSPFTWIILHETLIVQEWLLYIPRGSCQTLKLDIHERERLRLLVQSSLPVQLV